MQKIRRIFFLCTMISFSEVFSYDWSQRELLGMITPSQHQYFMKIPGDYLLASGTDQYVRKEVYEGFLLLNDAFYKQFGKDLKIISAYRSYADQKILWDHNPSQQLSIIALPGSSQHHCCALDLYKDPENREKYYLPWLQTYGVSFGFSLPFYGEHPYPFEQEDWHFVYTPLLASYQKAYYENISNTILDRLLTGGFASRHMIVEKFVLGDGFSLRYAMEQKQSQVRKQKQDLQGFIKKTSLTTGLYLLGTGDGVSYYQMIIDPDTLVYDSIRFLLSLTGDEEITVFTKTKNGILIPVSRKRKFQSKKYVYVVVKH